MSEIYKLVKPLIPTIDKFQDFKLFPGIHTTYESVTVLCRGVIR